MNESKPLTREEQMYWKVVAAEKMYQVLKSDAALLKEKSAIVIGSYPKFGKPKELEEIEEALALAEGRVKCLT